MGQSTRHASHGVAVSTLFAGISLVYSVTAQASFVPGHIDPGGNGIVPGFTLDAVFNIDNSCIPSGPGTEWLPTNAFSSSGGCGNATVYSAHVNLYDLNTPNPIPAGSPILGTFDLTPTDFWPILGVLVVNGAVEGVDTNIMGPDPGTSAWTGHNFSLSFDSGCFEGSCLIDPPPKGTIYMDGVDNSLFGTVTFGAPCTTATNCVVGTAPEPGTIGLALGALGGGWLARRRKRKTET